MRGANGVEEAPRLAGPDEVGARGWDTHARVVGGDDDVAGPDEVRQPFDEEVRVDAVGRGAARRGAGRGMSQPTTARPAAGAGESGATTMPESTVSRPVGSVEW